MTSFFLVKCRKCNCDHTVHIEPSIDLNNNFVLCSNCKKSSKLYSKTFCLEQLLLPINDLSSLKYLYCKSSRTKYYLDDDIENIVKIKFNEIEKNKERKMARIKHLESLQCLRKEKLEQSLAEYKLDVKPFGDCFTYIKYGYPKIEIVIKNEINKSIELSKRKRTLFKELQKFGLPYNETKNSICYDFVNGISNKTLNDIINDAKIENFFINHTDYLELVKVYPDDIAKEKALANYISKTDESNRHEVANNLIEKTFTINID